MSGETATTKNEGNGVWSFTVTPAKDSDGNPLGKDFTKVTPYVSAGTNPPGNVNITPKILNAGPGTTKLQLVPQGTPNPNLLINWTLNIDDQNDNVLASSLQLAVPDTTDADTLISMFDTDLANQGFPVVADGDTLSLTTPNNDYFDLTQSAFGNLYPLLSDEVIPEPSAFALLGIGVIGMLACEWRRQKAKI